MKPIVILTLVFAGIAPRVGVADSSSASKVFTAEANDMKAIVAGNTDFTFAIYGKLKNDLKAISPQGNLFFSPYSISTCLAMVYAGARGETQRQMAMALHFALPDENLANTFGALQKQLIQEDKTRGYRVLLANALWGRKDEPFLKEFLDLTKRLDARFMQLDFAGETEKSRRIINSWVEEKTQNKIKDLIPSGSIDSDTALVLTNAVYFKGQWKRQFDKTETQNMEFAISTKDEVKVPMMHLEENFKYYADNKLQALELPYKSDEISMLVLLPKELDDLAETEKTLTTKTIGVLLPKMQPTKVDVFFPKFKLTCGTFALNKALIELGMPDAFDSGRADFSGMNGKRNLWISDVFHKAFVEINEEGTEAAAATGAEMTLSGSMNETPVFRADHPFILIIKDNRSGSILFMGRLINPTE
jgi:serpin B